MFPHLLDHRGEGVAFLEHLGRRLLETGVALALLADRAVAVLRAPATIVDQGTSEMPAG